MQCSVRASRRRLCPFIRRCFQRRTSRPVNPETSGLLALPSPFRRESGMIRLLESAECRREDLYARIVRGTYDKPYILEDRALRYLCFGIDNIRTAMRISDPYALDLAFTREMMALLLFNSSREGSR